MLEALRVFVTYARQYFGRPIHGHRAMLPVLGEAGMGPATTLRRFLVFAGAKVDGSPGFANVDRFFAALAMEFIYSFALARIRATFVLCAE